MKKRQQIIEKLKQIMIDNGNPPQSMVAKRIGVARVSLGRWLRGENIPRYAHAKKIDQFIKTFKGDL